jgi:hypothetical protein
MDIGFSQHGAHFFTDIDPDRAPCNTAPATDTTAASVLTMPGAKLVGQPLTVTVPDLLAHNQAMNITVPFGKTGVPLPDVLTGGTIKSGFIMLTVAETGRTHIRTVATTQTAFRNLVPARVIVPCG